ncbi:uncharacterized protein KIAA1841-like [Paramuricea clavata]|uniref:Uncharacterized protein KIAA1841-like n=1 Tax=Paramuricea clavata TaxID=317549 RepID=A0A7D9E344_PARCT|nr:uncharacterized protein KIAA1841-like [Paramuricea clavata]
MALELVLKSLLSSTKFVNSSADEKDWVAIAKLIPGATPKQCARKWDELCHQNLLIKPSHTLSSSTRANSDLDSIVDFLLHKRESDESQDEVHVIEEDGNNEDSNNQVVYLTEKASEQGKSNFCGFIHYIV